MRNLQPSTSASSCRQPASVVPPASRMSSRGARMPQEGHRVPDRQRHPFQRGAHQPGAVMLRPQSHPGAAHARVEVGRALATEVREKQGSSGNGDVAAAAYSSAQDAASNRRTQSRASPPFSTAAMEYHPVSVADRYRWVTGVGFRRVAGVGRDVGVTTCAPVPIVSCAVSTSTSPEPNAAAAVSAAPAATGMPG